MYTVYIYILPILSLLTRMNKKLILYFTKNCDTIVRVLLNFINLLPHDLWIITTNFSGSLLTVIVATVMFVTVAMKRTEQTSTATIESSQANFFLAGITPIFYFRRFFFPLLLLQGVVQWKGRRVIVSLHQ